MAGKASALEGGRGGMLEPCGFVVFGRATWRLRDGFDIGERNYAFQMRDISLNCVLLRS